jgi:hypothetical protein
MLPVRAARWPDPGAVKRLTDLARSPEARTVEECFPAIKPGTPTYEFADRLLREYPESLQSLSIVMRESLRRQPPRSLLVPPRGDGHDPEQLARVFDIDPGTAPVPVPLSLSQRERQVTKRTQLVFEGLHRIEKMWSDDALWFLFSRLTGEDAFLFQHLDQRAQVEGALFDALEDAIRVEPFMKVLNRAISVAPYMDDYQREIILHALEDVKEGKYTLAVSPLLTGLEGSIKQAAVALSILDEDRWLVGESKNKKNRRHSADAIIKELKLDQEFERFLHRAVFGKRGNPIRHGEKPANTRQSALLAVVGVVGWMDVCLQISASSALANVMSLFLPDAVSRYRQLTGKRRQLGSGDDAPLTSWSVSAGTLTSSRALAAQQHWDSRNRAKQSRTHRAKREPLRPPRSRRDDASA